VWDRVKGSENIEALVIVIKEAIQCVTLTFDFSDVSSYSINTDV